MGRGQDTWQWSPSHEWSLEAASFSWDLCFILAQSLPYTLPTQNRSSYPASHSAQWGPSWRGGWYGGALCAAWWPGRYTELKWTWLGLCSSENLPGGQQSTGRGERDRVRVVWGGREHSIRVMSPPSDWGLHRTQCKPSPIVFSFWFILIAILISSS